MVFLNTTHLWRNVFTSSLTCVKKPDFFFCTEGNFLLLLIKSNTSSAEMIMQQEFLTDLLTQVHVHCCSQGDAVKQVLLIWQVELGSAVRISYSWSLVFSVYLHCHWTGDGNIGCWEFFFKVLLHVGFVARSSSHDALCVARQQSKQKWYGKNQICILVLC